MGPREEGWFNWLILYPIILVSFGFVFMRAFQGKVPRLVAVPFAINLVANLLFMPIFSGLRNVPLAAAHLVGGLAVLPVG